MRIDLLLRASVKKRKAGIVAVIMLKCISSCVNRTAGTMSQAYSVERSPERRK